MSALETGKANALREAVLASPKDDTPRLVYADYLSELGNPRGELITVQCLQTQLENESRTTTPEYRAAYWRGQQLEKRFVDVFRREDNRGVSVSFKRGFVDYVHAETMPILRAHVDQLEREPLRKVSVGAMTLSDLREIAAMPIARTLEQVSVSTADGYLTLDAPLAFEALRAGADDASAWPLNTGVPHPSLVPAVTAAYFRASTNEQLDELVQAAPPRLRELHFAGSFRARQGFARLVRTPSFERLEAASFQNFSDDDMVRVLEHGRALETLSLFIGPRPDTARIAAALERAPALPRFTHLTIACEERTMTVLAERAVNLESLIATDATSEEAITRLARSSLPKRLEHLSIGGDADHPSAAFIATAPFERLLHLGLHDVELPSRFAEAPALETLTRLHLLRCEMPGGSKTAILRRWPRADIE